MSKGRLPNHERASRGSADLSEGRVRFLGLSLGGGKADKAALAAVDYYPSHQKVFLTNLHDKIKNDVRSTADEKILDLVMQESDGAVSLAFDVPWRLPPSLRAEGDETHLRWMQDYLERTNTQKKKPKRIFTPYTQRCVEAFLSTELEEKFVINHAMSANVAPLLARAMYLQKRIDLPVIEVNPKVAVWRIGRSLDVMKSHLRAHRNSVGGSEARRIVLAHMQQKRAAFIYEQDRRCMVDSNHAFEAFICAFTGFLKSMKRTEPKPEDFPSNEDWVEIPKAGISWKEL